MTVREIRDKLEKAQETVEKKQGTLEKYYKKANKIRNQIAEHGWNIEAGRYQKHVNGSPTTEEAHECYWMFCDLDDALEGIERTKKAIAEKRGVVAKWESKLQEAEEKENVIGRKFPEILKEFQNSIVEMWDRWDLKRKERLKKEYDGMANNGKERFRAFIEKYSYTTYEFMAYTTPEEIHRENEKQSERVVMNLWNRVADIVGDATDWAGLYLTQGNEYEGCTVNGRVIGTKGIAIVETIGAGGYNIQKFHYRTLVHAVK